MHIEKEIKTITGVFIGVLLLTNVLIATSVKKPLFACIVVSVAIIVLYLVTLVLIKRFYKRVGTIREAMKGISVQSNYIAEKTRETFGELSDDMKDQNLMDSKKKRV